MTNLPEAPLNQPPPDVARRMGGAFQITRPLVEGAGAVHIQSPIVALVKVSQVAATEQGVEAVITDLFAPGMGRLGSNNIRIGHMWGGFSFYKDHWSAAPPAGWYLCFDAEIVELPREIAAVFERHGLTLPALAARNIVPIAFEKMLRQVRAGKEARP